jgi:hypothetical protein
MKYAKLVLAILAILALATVPAFAGGNGNNGNSNEHCVTCATTVIIGSSGAQEQGYFASIERTRNSVTGTIGAYQVSTSGANGSLVDNGGSALGITRINQGQVQHTLGGFQYQTGSTFLIIGTGSGR